MSFVYVRRYTPEDYNDWDKLVAESWNGTFLHSRKFLSYHRERFEDVSLVIENEKKRLIGVFPSALDPKNKQVAISHPGITYGGIVHDGSLTGEQMVLALDGIAKQYSGEGIEVLKYKVIPYIFHRIPSSDDLYALFRLKANRYRCDLGSVIDISNRPMMARRRIRSLKKAQAAGIRNDSDASYLEPFWLLLAENLRTKYGIQPVHTLEEITHLHSLFPQNIECVAALINDEVVAGAVLFHIGSVTHAQYSSANQHGRTVGALDAVFEDCIERARTNGKRYFNFGVSTEQEGLFLNESLYQFKSEFGSGGVVNEFYDLQLK